MTNAAQQLPACRCVTFAQLAATIFPASRTPAAVPALHTCCCTCTQLQRCSYPAHGCSMHDRTHRCLLEHVSGSHILVLLHLQAAAARLAEGKRAAGSVRGVAPALSQRIIDASAAVSAALVTAQRDNDSVYLQRIPNTDQIARYTALACNTAQLCLQCQCPCVRTLRSSAADADAVGVLHQWRQKWLVLE